MLATIALALAQVPCTPRNVISPTPENVGAFGRVLAASGGHVIASGDDPRFIDIFRRDVTTGDVVHVQSMNLDPGDGRVVQGISIDGNRAAISTLDTGSANGQGGTVILHRDGAGVWSIERALALVGEPLAGAAPELHRDTVIVPTFGLDSGTLHRVMVFDRDLATNDWQLADTLVAPMQPAAMNGFGSSISYNGRKLFVGAPLEGNGRVHFFQRAPSGAIHFRQTLASPGPVFEDFGLSLAHQGDRLVVGAPTTRDTANSFVDQGAAFLYRFVPSTQRWLRVQVLLSPIPSAMTRLGHQVALDDGYLVLSSDEGSGGAHYVYRYDEYGLVRLERYARGDQATAPWDGDLFGRGVALDGPLLYSGLTGPARLVVEPAGATDCDGDGMGDSCEILLDQEFDLNRNGLPDPCEATGIRYCSPGTANSTGEPARIGIFGLPRVGLLSLEIAAEGLPVAAPGYFLASRTNQVTANPGGWLGDLCLDGSPISRLVGGMRYADEEGRVYLVYNRPYLPGVGTGAFRPILPGQTWYFQYWYRDTGMTPSSNFSDAIEVTFTLF